MTDRQQREELAFLELANGDSGDPFADRWDDDLDDEETPDEAWEDFE